MSQPPIPSCSQQSGDQRKTFFSNRFRRLLLIVLVSGGSLLPAAIALADANSPTPGTVIRNQATGSFNDPASGNVLRNIQSNIVEVTVAEVAGITVTPSLTQPPTEAPSGVAGAGPNQGDGAINTQDVVYFTFDITNVGNDPTQFFIPGGATITNGTLSGSIEIISYSTDGTVVTTLTTPVAVGAGGVTTGTALGLPLGSIAPGGKVTVRVAAKASLGLANGDPLTVVLGDTLASSRGNQDYSDGGANRDLYTQDNQNADVVNVPATSTTEVEAAGNPLNGDATLRRREASAAQGTPIVLVSTPPTGGGGVCSADYGLVYSGTGTQIVAVHVESGASLPLTTNALSAVNGLSTDHENRQVYYGAGNSLYAWSPLTNTHVAVTSNFSGFLTSPPAGLSLSSGGAAFYNGSVYQGTDTGRFEIYKTDFVSGTNGLTVQSVTPLGIGALVANGTITGSPNWGDFIIDNSGVIIANGNGGQGYWSYNLNTNTFTDLVETFSTNSQLAKDGQGRLWALGAGDIFQVQIVGNNLTEVAGSRKPTPAHTSADAAECVRGTSSIGDFVWDDTNGDGVQDSGENGIANVTVDLVWDLDGDGVIDTNEPVLATRTTNSSGNYDFGELIFGKYIIRVSDTNNVLTGKTLSTSTAAFPVTLAVGTIDFNDADFGYQPPASDPNVRLVKRITAINRGLSGEQLFSSSFDDVGTPTDDDNAVNWPGAPVTATIGTGTVESYIAGIADGTINNTTVRPRDVLEYTIPFLSDGDAAAKDVLICDRIPTNTQFVSDAYNNLMPPYTGGGERGITLDYRGNTIALTNMNDGDETLNDSDDIGGYYFPAYVEPSATFPGIDCLGSNDNGAIVVKLSNIPNAIGDGTPIGSYGFIRFRVAID